MNNKITINAVTAAGEFQNGNGHISTSVRRKQLLTSADSSRRALQLYIPLALSKHNICYKEMICIVACIYIYLYIYTFIYYIHMHIYIQMYIHICLLCIYVYQYLHIYIYTHVHISHMVPSAPLR